MLVSNEGVEEPAVAIYLIGNALNGLNTDAESVHEYNEFIEVTKPTLYIIWFHISVLSCRQSFK